MRRSTVSLTLLVCLGLLVALGTASAQLAPTWKPQGREPFQKYDDPPAPPRKVETSPRMISRFGPFTSHQVNVYASGNNFVDDDANESAISVDPTNTSRMAIGLRQFDDVTSNFRQAGYGYTTDGGLTWTFPGVLQPGFFRSDPVTGSDETGTFFYLSLRSSWPVQTFFCDDMWRSTNGGATWDLISGKQGAIGGDKQWFTIDKTGGPGHHFQYQAFDQSNCAGGLFNRSTDAGCTWGTTLNITNEPILGTVGVMFVRSTDGGVTFSAPHKINDDPVNPSKWHWFGTMSVAPNGRLDAVWYDTRNAANNTDSQLFYSWSTDGGVTWAPNVQVSNSFNPFEGYPNQSKIGDYITIVSDSTGGNVAYAATFNFNPDRGQHEEDVYYVRVSPSGGGTPTPTPTATPTATATATATATPTATAIPTTTPTVTPTATPTPKPTATPRPTPTPRSQPTPRGRPTPPPRP